MSAHILHLQKLQVLTWLSTFRCEPQPRGQMFRILRNRFVTLDSWFLTQTRRDRLHTFERNYRRRSIHSSFYRRFRTPDARDSSLPRTCGGNDEDKRLPSMALKARPSLSPLGDTWRIDKGLKPLLIKEFGRFFKKQYADLRLQRHQVGTPMPVRRATLVTSTELVVEITKTKGSHLHKNENIGQLLLQSFRNGICR